MQCIYCTDYTVYTFSQKVGFLEGKHTPSLKEEHMAGNISRPGWSTVNERKGPGSHRDLCSMVMWSFG